MKLWCPPELFYKNMSHEQSIFMQSTYRDSSMCTKFKYFCKTWNFDLRYNFAQKYVSRSITFHVIHISWF